jgi:hypothetical protein
LKNHGTKYEKMVTSVWVRQKTGYKAASIGIGTTAGLGYLEVNVI